MRWGTFFTALFTTVTTAVAFADPDVEDQPTAAEQQTARRYLGITPKEPDAPELPLTLFFLKDFEHEVRDMTISVNAPHQGLSPRYAEQFMATTYWERTELKVFDGLEDSGRSTGLEIMRRTPAWEKIEEGFERLQLRLNAYYRQEDGRGTPQKLTLDAMLNGDPDHKYWVKPGVRISDNPSFFLAFNGDSDKQLFWKPRDATVGLSWEFSDIEGVMKYDYQENTFNAYLQDIQLTRKKGLWLSFGLTYHGEKDRSEPIPGHYFEYPEGSSTVWIKVFGRQ